MWGADGVRRFARVGAEDVGLDRGGARVVVSSEAGLETLDAGDGRRIALLSDDARAPYHPPAFAVDAARGEVIALVPSGEGAEALRPRAWRWTADPVGPLTIDGPSFPATSALAVSADGGTVAWGGDAPGVQAVRVWDARWPVPPRRSGSCASTRSTTSGSKLWNATGPLLPIAIDLKMRPFSVRQYSGVSWPCSCATSNPAPSMIRVTSSAG